MDSSSAKTYLTLNHTGGVKHDGQSGIVIAGFNYSNYYASGNDTGGHVVTQWKKIQIDPDKLLIHTGDFTFSSSTGILTPQHSSTTFTRMPYTYAFDCFGKYSNRGRANGDLRGTGFAFNDSWNGKGVEPGGAFAFPTQATHRVDISGGGHCGGFLPTDQPWLEKAEGDWNLRIKFVGF
jgi:hypothetical protein